MNIKIITTLGDISLKLEPECAPKTVANFLAYVDSNFYAGTIFHRVINDFMIQAGGLDANMQTKATEPPIANEANNGLTNQYGTIAMARRSDPHSAAAQFFINTNDNPSLDFQAETQTGWGYCVFGEVIDGMPVVNQIEEQPTTQRGGFDDVPVDVITIEKIVRL